jgi:hypothetical protein
VTYFTQAGDAFMPTAGRESLLNELPTGNYIVVQPMMGPMYFQRVEAFPEAGRMYGNVHQRAERIMRTFLDRPRSTGVLLEGEKGSGKSQLARIISLMGYDAGIPTIFINGPFFGDGFNALLSSIEQPAIVLVDEFEKVYRDQEHQEAILTLLDGVMTSQKLFIFTVNDKWKVNNHMKNRPGRLFYSIEFGGLEREFIREYCEENLNNQDHLEGILTLSAMFTAFNFDMLKAMVEEMNRYNETAFQVVELLNAKPLNLGGGESYDVIVTAPNGAKSKPVEVKQIPISGGVDRGDCVAFYAQFEGAPEWDGNEDTEDRHDVQLAEWERELIGNDPKAKGSVHHDGNVYVVVEPKGLKKVDVDTGRYQFIANNGMTVDFVKKAVQGPVYYPGAW